VELRWTWSAQPVPASPPRAAHRPAAARAPRTTPGCTCGHALLGPANPTLIQQTDSLSRVSAVRLRGRRAVVKDVGVRPPNDGQAAADDACPTARKRYPSGGARRACRSMHPSIHPSPAPSKTGTMLETA
jgi:hypothetical protein